MTSDDASGAHRMARALQAIPQGLPLIAVVGPTASGKSDWGIALARALGGEIISADSRQIYLGLDLGTGKVEGALDRSRGRDTDMLGAHFTVAPFVSEGVDHWMIDIAPPQNVVTMAQYQALALEVVADVARRGRTPVLVGGSGLYVSALADGLVVPAVPPDAALRARLEGKSTEDLAAELLALDGNAAGVVDLRNPRRMVRAIEVARATGSLEAMRARVALPYRVTMLGPRVNRDDLLQRIHLRLMARLEQGMVEEVERLLAGGLRPERLEDLGLEYRWVGRFLRGDLTRAQMASSLEHAIVRFAKRQATWFRNHGTVTWLDSVAEALRLASEATAAFQRPDGSDAPDGTSFLPSTRA